MSKKAISYTEEAVSPALAKEWLATQKVNRPLRESRLLKYARDMEAGRWLKSAQTIKFNENGELIDGQHRLHAVELARKTVNLEVARNVPAESMAIIDEGAPRTSTDVLSFSGATYRAERTVALSTIWRILTGKAFENKRDSLSRQELLGLNEDIGDEIGHLLSWIQVESRKKTNNKNYISWGVLAAITFLGRRAGTVKKADNFLADALHWHEQTQGSPLVAAQARFMRNFASKSGRLDRREKVALIIRAWNAYAKGETRGKLEAYRTVGGELSWPVMIGLNIEKVAPEVSGIFRHYKSDETMKAIAVEAQKKAGRSRRGGK